MPVRITSAIAVGDLISVASYGGSSVVRRTADYKRTVRALKHLLPGLTNEDSREHFLYVLNFHGEDGKPYLWLAKRLNKVPS